MLVLNDYILTEEVETKVAPDQEQLALRILEYYKGQRNYGVAYHGSCAYMNEKGDRCVVGSYLTEEECAYGQPAGNKIIASRPEIAHVWGRVGLEYMRKIQGLHDALSACHLHPNTKLLMYTVKSRTLELAELSDEPAKAIYRQLLKDFKDKNNDNN